MELFDVTKKLQTLDCKLSWLAGHPKYKSYFVVLLCSLSYIPSYLLFDAVYLSRIRSQDAYEKVSKLRNRQEVLKNLSGWRESKEPPSQYDHYSSAQKSIFVYSKGEACIKVYYYGGDRHLLGIVTNEND